MYNDRRLIEDYLPIQAIRDPWMVPSNFAKAWGQPPNFTIMGPVARTYAPKYWKVVPDLSGNFLEAGVLGWFSQNCKIVCLPRFDEEVAE